MILEGEVNWVLVLALVAGVATLTAIISLLFAVTHGVRHAGASGALDQVQKAAVSSDRRLFETLNAVPVALVETDVQGKFVFANRAAHQLLGRRDAELLGLRFHSATWGITYPDGRIIPPDLLPSARALRGQTVRGFQHVMANPATRRKMLVSVTAMPVQDEVGRITGSMAAIVETEGLTTPDTAAAAPPPPVSAIDLTRRVFEAASSALVVATPHGVIREINRTALDQLGQTRPDLPAAGQASGVIGADFADLFLGEDERAEGRRALREAVFATAEPVLARKAEGADILWRILPLNDPDDRIDALLLAGDPVETPAEADTAPEIESGPDSGPDPGVAPASAEVETLRRERDAAQAAAAEARAKAERLAAQVCADVDEGRLSGGAAQDFNALMSVMTSALGMMLRQADDPARVRRLGEAALAAGQRGEAITRRLMALSPPGEGGTSDAMDAGVLLRALEMKLRDLAGPRIDLLIEGPAGPAPVRLDPVAFEGAVLALVANAVEAAGPGGSVAVRLEATADGARLSVRDSGPGMDPDTLARASEPFFTTKAGAAGLGLAQVLAFARQSGGSLSIDSAPDQGSDVSVFLPAAEAVAA